MATDVQDRRGAAVRGRGDCRLVLQGRPVRSLQHLLRQGGRRPNPIKGWNGLPDPVTRRIDAVAAHPTNRSKVYFFKDDQYVHCDPEADRADCGYPKSIRGNSPG
ncbi:hemopexin repeat-containing protein [Streptomyces mexicanus]|uniref:hemopexin repeat-containing protein n=1 Tax=Streptomyces mexicanus TaxID=178566 RepID=UPI0036584BA4